MNIVSPETLPRKNIRRVSGLAAHRKRATSKLTQVHWDAKLKTYHLLGNMPFRLKAAYLLPPVVVLPGRRPFGPYQKVNFCDFALRNFGFVCKSPGPTIYLVYASQQCNTFTILDIRLIIPDLVNPLDL